MPFVKSNYAQFKAYAASVGRAADWKEWSEDEPCAQRAVTDDTQLAAATTPWCEVKAAIGNR